MLIELQKLLPLDRKGGVLVASVRMLVEQGQVSNSIYSISLSEQFDAQILRGIDGNVQFGVGHYINI